VLEFLSVNKIAFTLMGYPMSYIEFCGTLLYLWSVWLMVRRRMLTWPVGIISVLLYAALFYQIHLSGSSLFQVGNWFTIPPTLVLEGRQWNKPSCLPQPWD